MAFLFSLLAVVAQAPAQQTPGPATLVIRGADVLSPERDGLLDAGRSRPEGSFSRTL